MDKNVCHLKLLEILLKALKPWHLTLLLNSFLGIFGSCCNDCLVMSANPTETSVHEMPWFDLIFIKAFQQALVHSYPGICTFAHAKHWAHLPNSSLNTDFPTYAGATVRSARIWNLHSFELSLWVWSWEQQSQAEFGTTGSKHLSCFFPKLTLCKDLSGSKGIFPFQHLWISDIFSWLWCKSEVIVVANIINLVRQLR